MQNDPSRDCFDSGHLEKLIQIINQDTQDKPYIEEKAKQIVIDIGNAFVNDLLKKGVSIAKNKSTQQQQQQARDNTNANSDEPYEQIIKQSVDVNDFRIIAESKYNTKIDAGNSMVARQVAQTELEQQRREQDRHAQIYK